MPTTKMSLGGVVFTAKEVPACEYLPHKGVFLHQMLGKDRGDAFGFYYGRIEPGAQISREVHPETSETVYILAGKAVGLLGSEEVSLVPGQVMHVDKNVPHGLRNTGDGVLEFLVIGHPDF
jgi:mannose-6-phosphate isomerase-like protein (cupin superfamily)